MIEIIVDEMGLDKVVLEKETLIKLRTILINFHCDKYKNLRTA